MCTGVYAGGCTGRCTEAYTGDCTVGRTEGVHGCEPEVCTGSCTGECKSVLRVY